MVALERVKPFLVKWSNVTRYDKCHIWRSQPPIFVTFVTKIPTGNLCTAISRCYGLLRTLGATHSLFVDPGGTGAALILAPALMP
jgi:hypothetical protein